MYGLNGRDESMEMRARYSAMVNVLSDILNCGRWDIEKLFDSENNIVKDTDKIYVSIYDNNKDKFYNYDLVADSDLNREENKKIVINLVVKELINIIKNDI